MGIVWGAWAGRYELGGLNMEESNNKNEASSAKSTKIRCDPRFSGMLVMILVGYRIR